MDDQPRLPVINSILNPFDSMPLVRVHNMFAIYRQSDWHNLNVDSTTYKDVEVTLSEKKRDQIKWTETLHETEMDLDSGFFPSKGFRVSGKGSRYATGR